jgi:hypothetical protein
VVSWDSMSFLKIGESCVSGKGSVQHSEQIGVADSTLTATAMCHECTSQGTFIHLPKIIINMLNKHASSSI